jgi:hypothetical protein
MDVPRRGIKLSGSAAEYSIPSGAKVTKEVK